MNYVDPMGLYYAGSSGTDIERAIRHPGQAYKAYFSRRRAEGSTRKEYSSVPVHWNNEADAYRHAYWNADMARNIGKDIAEEIANAHESKAEQSNGELNMDLWNNWMGRELGADLSNQSKTTEQIIKEAIRNGLLQTNPNQNIEDLMKNFYDYKKDKKGKCSEGK